MVLEGSVADDAKALVRRLIEVYNGADWTALAAAMHPEYAHHTGVETLTGQEYLAGAAWLRRAFPDFRLEIADLIAEADRVAVRIVARGTHQGSLFGETPTSREIAFNMDWTCRLEDGLVVEDWELLDYLDLRRRLGALPVER